MRTRLYNARILTGEEGVFWGEVWVRDERIVYVTEDRPDVGERASEIPGISEIPWDLELDCRGDLLMPGFKNAHTHSAMTFLRSYADDVPLQQWLQEKVFP